MTALACAIYASMPSPATWWMRWERGYRRTAATIQGPQPVAQYDDSYYTVDFRDPNRFVLEMARTPGIRL